jgi:hypothetical protein
MISIPGLVTGSERRMFSYYLAQSAPTLSGCISSDFWCQVVPSLAVSEPSVRHSILALSSLHEYVVARTGSDVEVDRGNWLFAIQEYSKAVVEMRTWKPLGFGNDELNTAPAVPLIVCILFVCIELLAGHEAACQLHIDQGRKILHDLREGGAPSSILNIVKGELVPIFTRLSLASFLYGRHPANIPWHLKSVPAVVGEFASIAEARNMLYQAVDEVLDFSVLARRLAYSADPDLNIFEALRRTQTGLLSRLAQWHSAFVVFVSRPDAYSRGRRFDAELEHNMLLMYYHATLIWTSTSVQREETRYDSHIHSFGSIIMHATKVIEARRPGSSGDAFVFESEVIPPLYWTATKCRHPLLRREALELLSRDTVRGRREQLWKAEQTSLVAARIVEMEESCACRGQSPLQPQGKAGIARSQRPIRGQRPPLADNIKLYAFDYPAPESVTPESQQGDNADLSFMSHASDTDPQLDGGGGISGFSRQSSPSSISQAGVSSVASVVSSCLILPFQGLNTSESPYGVAEQQRVKNAVIGPDEVDGTWLTMFLDPNPGELEWKVVKEFVSV